MNRQTQWLFEAPFASNLTQYTAPHTTPEYFSNSELTDGCRSRTSDCPPSGVAAETISGYITHDTKVPEGEKRKTRAIADRIVRNANQGSQSIKVCIVGHADKDPRGENFERNISSQRAVEAMNELTRVISNPSILSKVSWKLICAGKDNPVVSFNKPLVQRQRNRRVEIFLNASPPPPPPRKEEPPRRGPEIGPLPPGTPPQLLCRGNRIFCKTMNFILSKGGRFRTLSPEAREQAIGIEHGLMVKHTNPPPELTLPGMAEDLIRFRQDLRRQAEKNVDDFTLFKF